MSKIYEDNTLTIGNTPLVRLNKSKARVTSGKIELVTQASVLMSYQFKHDPEAEKAGTLKAGYRACWTYSG